MKGVHVFTMGYMGSGKSRQGKKLAALLELPFVDLDDEIAAESGSSPQEWIEGKGELAFRKVEHESLLKLIDSPPKLISLGGGTPCYYNHMELLLKTGTCVYLYATPALLAERLKQAKKPRPLLKKVPPEELVEFIAKHLFERQVFYEQAQLRFPAADADPAAWAKQIAEYRNGAQ